METTTMLVHMLRRDVASVSDDDKIKRLWRMACDLKRMDSAWREAITEQPSAKEQSLYMLIRGHVCSDIFLYHREINGVLPDLHDDSVEFIIKELKSRGSDLGVSMNMSSEKEDECKPEDYWEMDDTLMDEWVHLDLIIDGLEWIRNSISNPIVISLPEKIEVNQSTKKEIDVCDADLQTTEELEEILYMMNGEKTRENTLSNILLGLSEGRRKRAYAPPKGKELACYREIRKWVTSTINFIKAKESWLQTWKDMGDKLQPRHIGGDARGNHFTVERAHKCSSNWEFINKAGSTSEDVFQAPSGHKIAVVFDELPEFQELFNLWKARFLGITQRLCKFKGTVIPTTNSIYVNNVGVEGRKRANVQEDQLIRKKQKLGDMPYQSSNSTAGNEGTKSGNRGKYLIDILSAFSGNEGSTFSQCCLSRRDVRLYSKIVEHVRSSIWLFHNRATAEEMQQYLVPVSVYEARFDAATEMVKERTPVQCLEDVVSLVEKIELEFFFTTPYADEVVLYEKIQSQLIVDLMDGGCYQKQAIERNTSGTTEQHCDLEVAAMSVLKAIWRKEKQIAVELEEQLGGLVRLILTQAPTSTKLTRWLDMNMDAAITELSEQLRRLPQRHELLDSLLLSLHEVDTLFENLVGKLTDVNQSLFSAVYVEKQFRVSLMEGWSALHALEASQTF